MNNLSDIKKSDICSQCGEIFTCELCKQGHGIKQERMNVSQMVLCQMAHEEKREQSNDDSKQ